MNLRGVSELRDLEHIEFRSARVENFAAEIQELHNQIKEQLKTNSNEYKNRANKHMRNLEFEVGDQVLAHIRDAIFLRGTYNKLKLKKIGPCNILRRFCENAYELEIPNDVRPVTLQTNMLTGKIEIKDQKIKEISSGRKRFL